MNGKLWSIAAVQGLIPFSDALQSCRHPLSGVVRNHFRSSKCPLPPASPPACRHPAPRTWTRSAGWAALPHQNLHLCGRSLAFSGWQETWVVALGRATRQGECNGDQGGEEEEREEGIVAWDGSGQQWLPRPSSTLQATEPGPPWLVFELCFWDASHSAMFSALFFLKMTGNHAIHVSFFPSSFQRFCERFSQLDVFFINKSRGSFLFFCP